MTRHFLPLHCVKGYLVSEHIFSLTKFCCSVLTKCYYCWENIILQLLTKKILYRQGRIASGLSTVARQGECRSEARISQPSQKKLMFFFIFFRFEKENTAWWWSVFHRNVIKRNVLGHSFRCLFVGMQDGYKCRSLDQFTVLKINNLYTYIKVS